MLSSMNDSSPPKSVREALEKGGVKKTDRGNWVVGPYHTLDRILDGLYQLGESPDRSDLAKYLRGEKPWPEAILLALAEQAGFSTEQTNELHLLWLQEEQVRHRVPEIDLVGMRGHAISRAEYAINHAHTLRVYLAAPNEADTYAEQTREDLRNFVTHFPRLKDALAQYHAPLIAEILSARTEIATGPYAVYDTTQALVKEALKLAESHFPPEARTIMHAISNVRLAVSYRFVQRHSQAIDELYKAQEGYADLEHQLIVAREMMLIASEQADQRLLDFWRNKVEQLLDSTNYSGELLVLAYEALAQVGQRLGDPVASREALRQGWHYHNLLPGPRILRYRTLQLLRAEYSLRKQHPNMNSTILWHVPPSYRAIREGEERGYYRIVETLRELAPR